jgi:hypothetical protein
MPTALQIILALLLCWVLFLAVVFKTKSFGSAFVFKFLPVALTLPLAFWLIKPFI